MKKLRLRKLISLKAHITETEAVPSLELIADFYRGLCWWWIISSRPHQTRSPRQDFQLPALAFLHLSTFGEESCSATIQRRLEKLKNSQLLNPQTMSDRSWCVNTPTALPLHRITLRCVFYSAFLEFVLGIKLWLPMG